MVSDRQTDDVGISIRDALVELYFQKQRGWSGLEQASPGKLFEIERHCRIRETEFATHVVPWLSKNVMLNEACVLEIGCGTGSSGAALAPHVSRVMGFDIDYNACEAARERWRILGLENIEAVWAAADEIRGSIDACVPDGSQDVALIFAVLEHQTVEERLATIDLCWRKIRDGGVLVIGETPNRLTYFDKHTSELSFFHLLPLELQQQYFRFSRRKEYVENLEAVSKQSPDRLGESLIRWGQSVSYHEFELVLGKEVHGMIVGHGHEHEMIALRPYRIEEKYLAGYLQEIGFKIHVGFSRYYLDLIIRKTNDFRWNADFSKLSIF